MACHGRVPLESIGSLICECFKANIFAAQGLAQRRLPPKPRVKTHAPRKDGTMSTLSLYNAMSVVDAALVNLNHILKKGEANAAERGIDPDIFLNARLAPDMYNLKRQVYVVTSLAKACPHRITGSEPPVYEDTEETFEALYARIAKARGELAKFS